MRPRTTLILLVLGAIVLGVGWQFGLREQPGEQTEQSQGRFAFPDLTGKLQNAARVELLHQGETIALAKNAAGQWGLVEKSLYPVQPEKLRTLLAGLTELRLAEPRTADAGDYAKLGVEDASGVNGTSTLVRVLDAGGKPIAELIVGHTRVHTQGNAPDQVYVRRPGEAQSWMAEGALPVDADPMLWLATDIANIDAKKIAGAVVTRTDQPGGDQVLTFGRDGDKIVLKTPADHRKLDDDKLSDIGRALEYLTFTDVKPASQETGTKRGTGVFTTTDGMVVTATLFGTDKDVWVEMDATGTGAAQKDAEALAAKVKGWDYQIGAWKQPALVPAMDQIKAAPPPAPAAAATAPAAAPGAPEAPAAPAAPASPPAAPAPAGH